MASTEKNLNENLRKDIGLISALSIVVGMVLGAGAFVKPPIVLAAAGDSNMAFLAWIVGGIFAMAGGLTMCELGVLFPRTGGVYVYLEEVYGEKTAYLFGWMLTFIFGPGTIGALTGYFSTVFCAMFHINDVYTPIVGASILAFVTIINSMGVKEASYLQTVATACKLVPLLLIIVFGLLWGNEQVLDVVAINSSSTAAPFSVAVLATLFAYDGWAQVASMSGEMSNPGKILPQAIVGGLIFLVVVYLCINVAFLKIISAEKLVVLGHNAASIAAQQLFGVLGGKLIAIGIMVSILGGINGYVMTLSRVILTMGERNQIIGASILKVINKDSLTPVNASVLLTTFAFLYYRLLDADKLADTSVFAIWIFYLLSFIGVIIARKKFADMPRSYKVPLYPLTPLIAIGGAIYVIYGMISNQLVYAAISISLTLAGLPVYYYLRADSSSIGLFRNIKTKYIILVGSLIFIFLMGVSIKVFDIRPTIYVAITPDIPPYTYEHNGNLSGYDIELMDAIATQIGYKVSYQAVSFKHLLDFVEKDEVDVAISNITITKERAQQVQFTNPYGINRGLAILSKSSKKFNELQDLAHKKVGVHSSTTADLLVSSDNQIQTIRFNSDADMFTAFRLGAIDAIIYDWTILQYYANNGIIESFNISKPITEEMFGIAVGRDNHALSEKLNAAIKVLDENGTLDKLHQKWFLSKTKVSKDTRQLHFNY